jgi:hypothetical protein
MDWSQSQASPPFVAPDPILAERAAAEEERRRSAEVRADAGEGRANEQLDISARGDARAAANQALDNPTKLRTEFRGIPIVRTYESALPIFVSGLQTGADAQGDLALINAYAKIMDPTSVVRQEEGEAVAQTANTAEQIAQRLKRELGAGGTFSDDTRRKLRDEMFLRIRELNTAYNGERQRYGELAQSFGLDPNHVIGAHYGQPFQDTIGQYSQQLMDQGFRRIEPGGVQTDGNRGPWTVEDAQRQWGQAVFDQRGSPLGPDGGPGYDAQGRELGFFSGAGGDTQAEIIANDPRFHEPDFSLLGKQGITLGLSDEAAGVGGFIGNLIQGENPIDGYNLWRGVERAKIANARDNLGWAGTAVELLSGGGGLAGKVGQMTLGQAARQGAALGGIGGFGYGEGLEGSAANAAGGAALGAGVGFGAQALGNWLTNPVSRQAAQSAGLTNRAQELSRAGQAEGVTVNRAMVDPALANRVTGVDSTLIGGPRVQRGMAEIEGQIEDRVGSLGRGGSAMDSIATGDRIKGAGERFIERSGQQAKRKYDRAERLAGNTRITPQESLRRVDEMIGIYGGSKPTGLLDADGKPILRVEEGSGLSETANVNGAEINFLREIRDDLSRDLSVGGLRRMRTKLRKKISKGDLVFGEDEARVLAIMDGAADDIRAGLTAQGKGGAARAFDAADKAYRARMEYITGTVQKLIGKRGASLSSEEIARKFSSMSRTDARGLRRFYATLDPDEAADVSATFAEQIGRNNKGEFSVAHFLAQTAPNKLSDEAARTIFGPQGAESIRNLRALGREVNRVTSAMNSRTSKSGVAGGWRDLIFNTVLGGIAGGGAGLTSGSVAAMAGAATVVGANSARNFISARGLMSPNLTKWLRQIPAGSNSSAMQAHLGRLGQIAKLEPALAGDIDIIRRAVNDNLPVTAQSVAQEQDPNERNGYAR